VYISPAIACFFSLQCGGGPGGGPGGGSYAGDASTELDGGGACVAFM